jgi:hypothetical protein
VHLVGFYLMLLSLMHGTMNRKSVFSAQRHFHSHFSKPFWNVWYLPIGRKSGFNYSVNNYLVVTYLDEGNPKTELESVLETRCIISVHTLEKVKRPVVPESLLTALYRLQSKSVIVFVWNLL